MSCVCNAGFTKLVVMYDGTIIPCEAFKGLLEKRPECNLGNIRDGTTMEQALERAKKIEWLTCFQKRSVVVEKLKERIVEEEKKLKAQLGVEYCPGHDSYLHCNCWYDAQGCCRCKEPPPTEEQKKELNIE